MLLGMSMSNLVARSLSSEATLAATPPAPAVPSETTIWKARPPTTRPHSAALNDPAQASYMSHRPLSAQPQPASSSPSFWPHRSASPLNLLYAPLGSLMVFQIDDMAAMMLSWLKKPSTTPQPKVVHSPSLPGVPPPPPESYSVCASPDGSLKVTGLLLAYEYACICPRSPKSITGSTERKDPRLGSYCRAPMWTTPVG